MKVVYDIYEGFNHPIFGESWQKVETKDTSDEAVKKLHELRIFYSDCNNGSAVRLKMVRRELKEES